MASNSSVLRRKNARLTGPLDDDVVPFSLEPFAQRIGNLLFVFDDEYAHSLEF